MKDGATSAADQLGAAQRLLKTCPEHEGHARQVARLAPMLFDELADLHGMGGEERFLLECAALLHDIGWIAGQSRHHKTSLHVILDTPLLSFDAHQRRLIGSVARYHRKAPPGEKHRHYAELEADDRRVVRVLAAVLRVADALDVRHVDAVDHLWCKTDPDRLIIGCRARENLEIERVAAGRKGRLLEQILERKLVLVRAESDR